LQLSENNLAEIEEIFSPEYADNEDNDNSTTDTFTKTFILDIFFIRKERSILIEKWKFQYRFNDSEYVIVNSDEKSSNSKLNKINTLQRSIYTLTRVLPSYSISKTNGL
jgi:hypothetical protein